MAERLLQTVVHCSSHPTADAFLAVSLLLGTLTPKLFGIFSCRHGTPNQNLRGGVAS